MSTVTVAVTKDDIDKGLRKSAHRCAVARALTRATGKRCYTTRTYWDFWDTPLDAAIYPFPREAMEFIDRYDRLEIVEPFEFEVEI